ncbi:MAG TPA: hypothetical protein VNR18_11215 [Hyphomicrobiales bacterium]|nr:hypothetical protein [Hyphomicrobiales bacterium]
MKLLLQMLVVGLLTALVAYGALSLWHRPPADSLDAALASGLTPMQSALGVAQTRGCQACHSIDGSDGVGPSWRGVWGQLRESANGDSRHFDAAYLRESISNPAAHVVKGFQNVMLPVTLSEAELQQLEYLFRELGQTSAH